ncbi:hypothetical protein D9M71_76980 [compost metagenome]
MNWRYGLAALIGAGLLATAVHWAHTEQVRKRPLLPINFDHRTHGQVNCLTCHHDYQDKSQAGAADRTCVLCHKQTPALAVRIEADFHSLCRGCHLQQLQRVKASGPVQACRQCHTPAPIPAR